MVWKGTPNGDHLAPTLVTLIDEVDARAPRRARGSDGSIGNREHQSRTSDHNPDSNGVVRALDITDDPDHFDPDDFAEVLIARRDPRIKYLISDGRVCTSYDSTKGPAWTWRPYTGSNGHFAHVHISTLPAADNDRSTWFPSAPTPIREDDEMVDHFKVVTDLYIECGRKPGTELRARYEWALELEGKPKAEAIKTYDYIAWALKGGK